ncbi:DNA translocase FtsK [Aliirhizobium smilacinae]|uniref:DNA translocase FtsK n=1 Tax=Aliirhizobium smilacinae TaxID=1395944 RepID=UPI00374305F3
MAANDAEQPLPLPEPIPAVELDPEKLPTWQRAFILAPNVRFTRTPGRSPARPESETDDAAEDAGHVGGLTSVHAPQPVAVPVSKGHPAPHHVNTGSQVNNLQRRIGKAFAPAASVSQPIEAAIQRVVEQPIYRQSSVTAAVLPEIVPVANAPVRRATSIPDHLIWEMMSLGASENVEQKASPRVLPAVQPLPKPVSAALKPTVTRFVPPAPMPAVVAAAPVIVPVVHEAPSAIDLYRQIAIRQIAPAQTTIEPLSVPFIDAAAYVTPAEAVVEQSVAAIEPIEIQPAAPVVARKPRVLQFADDYTFPEIDLLQPPAPLEEETMSQEALEQSAGLLESILEDFGVKGEIIDVRPGPVVTLYEFAPAPGVKSSRVMNLSDDIARSMSALSARVAVIPGRNVIGIELPNVVRETVYLRELVESNSYIGTDYRLPLCLGKTIGGEPVIAELAKMPHLLVAGTTGSGKSVAINTMILSLLYHLRPEECRLIMVDPKMLELSVYDGIPHLLTPVVTDPKKAVLALKWAVREMEERYRKMSRLNVRNIDGFNARVSEARNRNETIMINVPVGFDRSTGEQIFEEQALDLTALPYIVVIIDEMADLMMVAGKEIEGAVQRLAQMARAAGIHLIMATQRPSVDVITGTIKANFPTRISFQVTSKIDSRTILGEQGAEHLLGQGDMLHMKGGGRISRVHGPFVSDYEVEKVVAHLKTQGQPSYLGSVTEDEEDDGIEEEEDVAVFDQSSMGAEDNGDDLYERAVKIVQRDKKCSTSYIQRRLSIGYNRAASLVERMEKEGLVGAPNHVGKREILGPQQVQPRSGEE